MIRLAATIAATTAIALSARAVAQDHSMRDMPGVTMPTPAKKAPAKKPAPRPVPRKATPQKASPPQPAARKPAPSSHSAAAKPAASPDAPTMPDIPGMQMQPVGTALPAGNALAPRPPMDHYADRQFPSGAMQQSRDVMMRESGGKSFYQVMVNLAEYQARKDRDGYRWDGEAWFGGDIDRLTLKSEGEGVFRRGVESAEIQALYSRAIDQYFNLQAGVRHDFEPGRSTTYATVGFEGLAPYWFEVEGAAFLSDRGDLLGRLEGYYDQRITQRTVLQPRVEFNLAAQDVPETRTGAGLASAGFGLRLRYDINRKLGPYIGLSYEAKTGQTARYARADGEDPTVPSLVAGIRLWF